MTDYYGGAYWEESPNLNILSDAEALAAINSTGVATDELRMAVAGISQVIDALCGPVVDRTVTEVHPMTGQSTIWLSEAPTRSVTSVTEFDGTTSAVLANESAFGTVGGPSGFALSDGGHSIERRSGGYPSRFVGQVQVVYLAGRYATTSVVGARWKYAASAILRRLWKREGSAWAFSPDFYANTDESAAGMSFFRAVKPMVDEFLADECKPPAVA